jgi:6-phosphogluconolactonase
MALYKPQTGGRTMMDRRVFTTLLAGGVAAPLSPRLSLGESAAGRTAFYSGVATELTLYDVDVDNAALSKHNSVMLPANIQYAWEHPSKKYFYVVSSGGGPGVASDSNFANAFRLDAATGALAAHGEPRKLPHRPIHTSVDMAGEYLLTAYNDPSSLTVHRINADGTWATRSSNRTRSTPANMPTRSGQRRTTAMSS